MSAMELQSAETSHISGIETWIDGLFSPASSAISSVIFYELSIGSLNLPLIVVWLIIAAAFFTVVFRGVQFREFKHAGSVIRGRYSSEDDPGEISHFQALSSAVSGTVGLGNIAGVAVAITLGGPGATFWMILAGFLGMCTKFVECTLAVKYRIFHSDGTVTGGPFQYLPIAFKRFGKSASRILTCIFTLGIIFFGLTGIAMFQSNQAFAQMRNATGGGDGLLGGPQGAILFGIALAVIVGFVISGGIKSIGKVTGWLVPLMAVLYVAGGLAVIGINAENIPSAVGSIITGAFTPEGVGGGVLGTMIIGFQRAAFSNEA